MNVDGFPERLARDLQADPATVSADTRLEDIPEYDSLGRLTVLASLDARYGVQVDVEELSRCITVSDLVALIGSKDGSGT